MPLISTGCRYPAPGDGVLRVGARRRRDSGGGGDWHACFPTATDHGEAGGDSVISMLLAALALGLVLSVVCCALALLLFPWFRSGERKPGAFRPDESTGKSRAVMV